MNNKKIARRREILESVFRKRLDQPIPYTEFQNALRQAGQEVGIRSIQHTFTQWRKEFLEGLRIERIGRDDVLVAQTSLPIGLERKARNQDVKGLLGAALWQYLFDVEIPKAPPRVPIRHSHLVLDKIEALRLKSNLIMNIDAGSTTEAAVEQLMRIDSFPIRVPVGKGENRGFRFISPTIFTNSLSIAASIARRAAEGHSHDMELFLIGGLFRAERGSIVGDLAQTCLKSWQMRADLSIIGTTGFRRDHTGCPAFACDNISEAQMKLSLLDSWFRVVILDSSKLRTTSVSSVFVPLSHPSLDLVVIDDGLQNDARDEVEEFVVNAGQRKVACLVVPTGVRPKTKPSGSIPHPPRAKRGKRPFEK